MRHFLSYLILSSQNFINEAYDDYLRDDRFKNLINGIQNCPLCFRRYLIQYLEQNRMSERRQLYNEEFERKFISSHSSSHFKSQTQFLSLLFLYVSIYINMHFSLSSLDYLYSSQCLSASLSSILSFCSSFSFRPSLLLLSQS